MSQQTPHEYNTDETLAADIGHDEHGAADAETDTAELTARIAELEGRLQDEQLRSAAAGETRNPDVIHRDLGFQLLQSKVALAEMPCTLARLDRARPSKLSGGSYHLPASGHSR